MIDPITAIISMIFGALILGLGLWFTLMMNRLYLEYPDPNLKLWMWVGRVIYLIGILVTGFFALDLAGVWSA